MDQERGTSAEDFRDKSPSFLKQFPIIINPYMIKGETWFLEGNVIVTPFNDLVWEKTWEKILQAEREIAFRFLDVQVLQIKRKLGLPA